MAPAGGKIIAATLGAHTTVRPDGYAQICAVHFLFDNHFSGQEFEASAGVRILSSRGEPAPSQTKWGVCGNLWNSLAVLMHWFCVS